MPDILQSRRFWALVFDAIVSLTTYFVAKYAAPALAEDAVKVIAVLQPIFWTVVVAYTVDDYQAAKVELAQINANLERISQ